MIEVGMGQQNEIDRRQILDFEAGALDPFDEEQPVGEIGIDQDVQIRELHQKGRVTDPGQSHLAIEKVWKAGPTMFPMTFGDESFPDHLMKERARIEMIAGS